MSIIKRVATSKEMKKNYNIVKNMSGGMKFDENMEKNINQSLNMYVKDNQTITNY